MTVQIPPVARRSFLSRLGVGLAAFGAALAQGRYSTEAITFMSVLRRRARFLYPSMKVASAGASFLKNSATGRTPVCRFRILAAVVRAVDEPRSSQARGNAVHIVG